MRVGFDISQSAYIGGVGTYTKNLAKELSSLKELEMVFFYSSLRSPYKGDLKGVKQFKLPPILLEFLFNRTRKLPIEKFIGSIDVFHSSDWTQPPSSAKKVTTYHDVIPLKYPQWSHPKVVEVHKRRLKIVEKEIDMVIAVSESTKRDLLEVSSIPSEKITVIYEGVGKEFRVMDEKAIDEFKKKKGLPDRFVLAISGVGNRRNLERVKEASKGYELVILGETIKGVSQEELPLLYNSASVLLYPSFYEGFGLPVLEAMACGTPVITSNVSSLPEVGGDGALYVDPDNTEEIKEKLKNVMEDKELQRELREKGLSRAKQFSWEKCARETYEIYKQILKKE